MKTMERDQSTLQELAGFMKVMHGIRKSNASLLRGQLPSNETLVYHLNKQLGKKAA
jgi:hypothetical protein